MLQAPVRLAEFVTMPATGHALRSMRVQRKYGAALNEPVHHLRSRGKSFLTTGDIANMTMIEVGVRTRDQERDCKEYGAVAIIKRKDQLVLCLHADATA